jgi:hypothetical protein
VFRLKVPVIDMLMHTDTRASPMGLPREMAVCSADCGGAYETSGVGRWRVRRVGRVGRVGSGKGGKWEGWEVGRVEAGSAGDNTRRGTHPHTHAGTRARSRTPAAGHTPHTRTWNVDPEPMPTHTHANTSAGCELAKLNAMYPATSSSMPQNADREVEYLKHEQGQAHTHMGAQG